MNQMSKQAMVPGAGLAASWVAQNVLGAGVVRTKKFHKSVAKSALMGALGKKSPRTIKSVSKDMASAIAVPEVNQVKNEVYNAARSKAKETHLSSKLSLMTKRQKVVARLTAAGEHKRLKRIGQSNNPIVHKVRSQMKESNIPNVSVKSQKEVLKLPNGHRPPASTKAAIAANVALAGVDPATAGVNAAKLVSSTKKVSDTKAMQRFKKWAVTDPMKRNKHKGEIGKSFSHTAHAAQSVIVNPFTAYANKLSHRAGAKSAQHAAASAKTPAKFTM